MAKNAKFGNLLEIRSLRTGAHNGNGSSESVGAFNAHTLDERLGYYPRWPCYMN